MSAKQTILIVDDESIYRDLLSAHLNSAGYVTEEAEDGQKALDLIFENTKKFNAILLDRRMPGISGEDVLDQIKAKPETKHIPVIMQTALKKDDDIEQCIEKGAFYYLIKPLKVGIMLSVVHSAVSESRKYRELISEIEKSKNLLRFFDYGTFSCSKPQSANQLAGFLAGICPEPENAVIGLGELILNAIEHGNLSIDYDLKSELMQSGEWTDKLEEIIALPENKNKRVTVTASRNLEEIEFRIKDHGNGFDWKNFLTLNADRAYDSHGRGVALSKSFSFDELYYEDDGSLAVAKINLNGKIWY